MPNDDGTAGVMSGHVSGKVAVVTGAGQGHGAAEARLLATEGATSAAVMMPDEHAPAVPELARRAALSSCRHDPVRAFAPS